MSAINNLILAARIVDAFQYDKSCLIQFLEEESIVPINEKQAKKDFASFYRRYKKLKLKNNFSVADRLAKIEFIEKLLNENK